MQQFPGSLFIPRLRRYHPSLLGETVWGRILPANLNPKPSLSSGGKPVAGTAAGLSKLSSGLNVVKVVGVEA